MKLTKGKISKLYNKKRQSLKKHKKLKTSYKKRTFRNKRKINLARKSLKRLHHRKYKGGDGDDTPKDDTKENIKTETTNQPVISDESQMTETTDQPVISDESQMTETTDNSTEGVLDVPIQPTEQISASDVVEVTDKGDTETTDNSTEGVLDVPIQPTEQISASDVVKVTDKGDAKTTEQPVPETIIPREMPNKEELLKSLSNVVDYITDVVTDKVSKNVSSAQFGEKPQEGFESVNKAAKIIASSGGSKIKKTRRLRLTNKKTHL